MSKRDREQRRAERAAAIVAAQRRKERNRKAAIIAVVAVVVVVIVGGVLVQSARDDTGGSARPPRNVTDTYALADGQKTAPVKVVVYEDLQCPICKDFESKSRETLRQAAAAGKVYVEYRPISFINDYSSRAANALASVLDEAGPTTALKFHDELYEQQPSEQGPWPSATKLVDLAVQAGASKPAVAKPIEKDAFAGWVKNATDAGSKKNVNQTPTVFLNGKALKGESVDQLVSSVDTAITQG